MFWIKSKIFELLGQQNEETDLIIGQDDIKEFVDNALDSPLTINVLFNRSPGTGKTERASSGLCNKGRFFLNFITTHIIDSFFCLIVTTIQ